MSPVARIAALFLLATVACGAPTKETYSVEGVVRAVDRDSGSVKISHGDISGFMPAMTMNFDVVPPSLLEGVKAGARVRFTLERDATTLRITAIEVTTHGSSGVEDEGMGGLAERDPAPDFRLVDQDGRSLSLSELRGKAVVLDFVFTSCPGPCPLLTSSHVTLQRKLPPEIARRCRFVSISLDPENDTPEAMRKYALDRGAELEWWSFLTGDPDAVRAVLRDYKVGWSREADGTINHLVITFLIDPEGRIARRYLGLEHPPEKILRDLRQILVG